MDCRVVLIVDSDLGRLGTRRAAARAAGYLALRAATLARARELLDTVEVDLVVVEAQLADGRSASVVRTLRAEPALRRLPLAVLGPLTPQERRELAADRHVHRAESGDMAAFGTLLGRVLGPPEP